MSDREQALDKARKIYSVLRLEIETRQLARDLDPELLAMIGLVEPEDDLLLGLLSTGEENWTAAGKPDLEDRAFVLRHLSEIAGEPN